MVNERAREAVLGTNIHRLFLRYESSGSPTFADRILEAVCGNGLHDIVTECKSYCEIRPPAV